MTGLSGRSVEPSGYRVTSPSKVINFNFVFGDAEDVNASNCAVASNLRMSIQPISKRTGDTIETRGNETSLGDRTMRFRRKECLSKMQGGKEYPNCRDKHFQF